MRLVFSLVTVAVCLCQAAARYYSGSGLVLSVNAAEHTVSISHSAIAGLMPAMAMPFQVRDVKILSGVQAGDRVRFRLAVDTDATWIEGLEVVRFESAARDPALASRLKLLDEALDGLPAGVLLVGDAVPDFQLVDQDAKPVSLSQFRGKTVALDFIYTRCPLPDYCFRLSRNFGVLRKRFAGNRDVVLLTITFDPVHDRPDVLKKYAEIWKADPAQWRFLTGATEEVQRVCGLFGVQSWRDEGLYVHSLHTAIIDGAGKLAANLEGNDFTAGQIGDLVETARNRR